MVWLLAMALSALLLAAIILKFLTVRARASVLIRSITNNHTKTTIGEVSAACETGFAIFDRANVSRHGIYCVYISSHQQSSANKQGTPVIVQGNGGFQPYHSAIVQFLTDVSKHCHYQGFAYAVAEDSSTMPATVSDALWSLKQPLLSHAHLMPVSDDVIFIPDFHFISSYGFTKLIARNHRHAWRPYTMRSPVLFWRGSTTGQSGVDNCFALPRVRLCQAALLCKFCDIKISQTVQVCNGSAREQLHRMGMIGESRKEHLWSQHKAILDIDGNVGAWGLIWYDNFLYCNYFNFHLLVVIPYMAVR